MEKAIRIYDELCNQYCEVEPKRNIVVQIPKKEGFAFQEVPRFPEVKPMKQGIAENYMEYL
jgi:hypothetical protein